MKKGILIVSVLAFCFGNLYADEPNIVILSKYITQTYREMLKEFGTPKDKTSYTIANAPTKGWNHRDLFSKYPKNEKNKNIKIMEVTWTSGDFLILACYHEISGTNRCLVAKRIKKGIKF